jgi:hypothetical protein
MQLSLSECGSVVGRKSVSKDNAYGPLRDIQGRCHELRVHNISTALGHRWPSRAVYTNQHIPTIARTTSLASWVILRFGGGGEYGRYGHYADQTQRFHLVSTAATILFCVLSASGPEEADKYYFVCRNPPIPLTASRHC